MKIATLKLGLLVSVVVLVIASLKWFGSLECPTSKDYSPNCLATVLPPWPICFIHNADYYVQKAKEGATRCCLDDLKDCRCPKTDSPKFLDNIQGWCEGVQKCVPCDGEHCSKILGHDKLHQIEEECPRDDAYSDKCLKSAIPPYPICLNRSVKQWVEKAISDHDDCCGDDPNVCKCPKKETVEFQNKIADWCAGVETCAAINTKLFKSVDSLQVEPRLRAPPRLAS